jgi:thiol-disulfide isomerase/thioredoxin
MTLIWPALAAAALLLLATALGLLWRRNQGRLRVATGSQVAVSAADLAGATGQRPVFGTDATLLQFSTEFCSRCPATRRLLGSLTQKSSDYPALSAVAHVDVDLTHRPDLARRFNILQTPTTLILDRDGVVTMRIGGAPRREDVVETLRTILKGNNVSYNL